MALLFVHRPFIPTSDVSAALSLPRDLLLAAFVNHPGKYYSACTDVTVKPFSLCNGIAVIFTPVLPPTLITDAIRPLMDLQTLTVLQNNYLSTSEGVSFPSWSVISSSCHPLVDRVPAAPS